MSSLLSNTEELLLICLQKDLTRAQKEKAQALIKERIDWEHFLESAMRGGVTVLVYNALRGFEPSVKIPQPVLDRLKAAFLFLITKATYQYAELLNLLRLFAKSKIPVVPLKGVILAKRLYGDIAVRSLSVDHDLLIEEKNRKPAQILLEGVGYSFEPQDPIIKSWQCCFIKSKATIIEMHWDITKMYRSKERIEEFWRGVRLVEEDGISYYEFKEEELLLYLSAQMFNDCCFVQLRYICQIHQLLYRYKGVLNWGDIAKKAKRWNLSNSLYAALKLSGSLFNSEMPDEVLRRLKPGPLKIILINLFVNKKVILRNRFRRRLVDNFLKAIFFELIEAKSAKDYFSIIFLPKEVRDKGWSARMTKGISTLSRMLLQRDKA